MVAGICGGIGEHLDVDPTVIRLIWIVVTLISLGVGFVAYIIAWIIVPEQDMITDGQPATGANI
jgi:phage shock protein PspC (stress-responsive transcriptional regulator)